MTKDIGLTDVKMYAERNVFFQKVEFNYKATNYQVSVFVLMYYF